MSLYLDLTVDPVAALDKRQLNFLPKHFHAVLLDVDFYLNTNAIKNWIWCHQSGRFYLGNRNKIIDNKIAYELIAAFEDSSEAIMFSFMLPALKNSNDDTFIV